MPQQQQHRGILCTKMVDLHPDTLLLADSFRVLCVSYDGFDETEQTEFSTMLEETQKIEAYLKTHCGVTSGQLTAALWAAPS